jgi:hypothetical protein
MIKLCVAIGLSALMLSVLIADIYNTFKEVIENDLV